MISEEDGRIKIDHPRFRKYLIKCDGLNLLFYRYESWSKIRSHKLSMILDTTTLTMTVYDTLATEDAKYIGGDIYVFYDENQDCLATAAHEYNLLQYKFNLERLGWYRYPMTTDSTSPPLSVMISGDMLRTSAGGYVDTDTRVVIILQGEARVIDIFIAPGGNWPIGDLESSLEKTSTDILNKLGPLRKETRYRIFIQVPNATMPAFLKAGCIQTKLVEVVRLPKTTLGTQLQAHIKEPINKPPSTSTTSPLFMGFAQSFLLGAVCAGIACFASASMKR